MKKFIYKHKILIIVIGIIIFSVLSIIFLRQSRIFSRRSIREAEASINSYGNFSGIVIFALILISTLIPPLPIPIPLVEIVSGLIFGFWHGFIISLIAQVVSSSAAFYFSRILGRKYFRRIINNKLFKSYKQYINKNGSKAVFMLRATIGSPFNMVSFFAGLTEMDFKRFFTATLFGSLPEVIIFNLIGSLLQTEKLRVWYVFVFVIILGGAGMISTLWIVRRRDP